MLPRCNLLMAPQPMTAPVTVSLVMVGFLRFDGEALLAKALDLVEEGAAADAQGTGRLGAVVVVLAQTLENDGPLHLLHAPPARGLSGHGSTFGAGPLDA